MRHGHAKDIILHAAGDDDSPRVWNWKVRGGSIYGRDNPVIQEFVVFLGTDRVPLNLHPIIGNDGSARVPMRNQPDLPTAGRLQP